MSSQALALATWLPDVESLTPNIGDVVQVVSVPVNHTPNTQFAAKGSGTGGGGGALSTLNATKQGQFVISGAGPTFALEMGDADGGRF